MLDKMTVAVVEINEFVKKYHQHFCGGYASGCFDLVEFTNEFDKLVTTDEEIRDSVTMILKAINPRMGELACALMCLRVEVENIPS